VSDVTKMTGFFDGPKVEVLTSSGMLCVTVHSRPHWLVVALGGDVIFAAVLYYYWPFTPLFGRVVWTVILVSTLISSIYEFLGEEIIEIDSQRLTIRKGNPRVGACTGIPNRRMQQPRMGGRWGRFWFVSHMQGGSVADKVRKGVVGG
jgi:hypothetical protein